MRQYEKTFFEETVHECVKQRRAASTNLLHAWLWKTSHQDCWVISSVALPVERNLKLCHIQTCCISNPRQQTLLVPLTVTSTFMQD